MAFVGRAQILSWRGCCHDKPDEVPARTPHANMVRDADMYQTWCTTGSTVCTQYWFNQTYGDLIRGKCTDRCTNASSGPCPGLRGHIVRGWLEFPASYCWLRLSGARSHNMVKHVFTHSIISCVVCRQSRYIFSQTTYSATVSWRAPNTRTAHRFMIGTSCPKFGADLSFRCVRLPLGAALLPGRNVGQEIEGVYVCGRWVPLGVCIGLSFEGWTVEQR